MKNQDMRGRPKIDNPANDVISLRCRPEQKEKWKKAAMESNMSLSEWLKYIANEYS